jgi:hypothetical protein
MPRPKYAVRAFSSDAAKAKELLSDIRESPPFALDQTNDLEKETGKQASRAVSAPEHEWSPAAANIEIWTGEDGALAELLEACLRENRIGVRREGAEPTRLRLLIMPADEPAARDIIREVREATPPL